MNRRLRAPAIAAGAVFAIAAATFLTVRAGVGESHRRRQSAGAHSPLPEGPVGELLRLLDRSQAATYTLRLASTDTSSGARATVWLWRRPPLVRTDTESGEGDAARRSAKLFIPSGSAACTRAGSGPWDCKARPDLRAGDLDVLSADVVSRLSRVGVAVADDTIGGEAVRCFVLTEQDTTTQLCLTSDGIPVRVVTGKVRAEVAQLDRSPPPEDVFRPPAPPHT